MTDDRIREYLNNGGKLFNIYSIDRYRDGGTLRLNGFKIEIFVHSKDKTYHTSYPPTENNKINDELLIEYINSKINSFFRVEESKLELLKRFFNYGN